MLTLHTYGASSDAIILRVPKGIPLQSLANPGSPVVTTLNWITAGYADDDELDGKNNTLPSIRATVTNTNDDSFATLWQDDVAVLGNGIPLLIAASAPTVPYLVAGCPRVPGHYQARLVFTYPNGQSTEISRREFKVE